MKLNIARYIKTNFVKNERDEEGSQVVWYLADEDRYFVTSATRLAFRWSDDTPRVEDLAKETYIFEADQTGHIKDFTELDGSIKGILSHFQCLKEAGILFIQSEQGKVYPLISEISHLEELIYIEKINKEKAEEVNG